MKINDVIKKCIKIPGISIKQAEYSMELILNTKEGKGSMTFFSLFPGLSLAYIFINSPTWTAPDLRSDSSITKGPLLLPVNCFYRAPVVPLSLLHGQVQPSSNACYGRKSPFI